MQHIDNATDTNITRTPGNWSGGFLFDLALPPIAVLVVGFVMALFLSQVHITKNMTPPGRTGRLAPFFTPEVQYWEAKIIEWSDSADIDPNLVATVMQIESCGNPRARSSVGAMGLFQVMPYHFSEEEDPYKPNTNARRGLAYLKRALNARGGSPRLALAGYNGGITGTKGPESAWPNETIRYVYWGEGIYSDAVEGKSNSQRLEAWLKAGGASLCKKASQYLGIAE